MVLGGGGEKGVKWEKESAMGQKESLVATGCLAQDAGALLPVGMLCSALDFSFQPVELRS